MSMKTNPIIGFGAKINYENVDILKYAKATGIDNEFYNSLKQKVNDSTYVNVIDMVDDLDWNFEDDFLEIIGNSNIADYFKTSIGFTHSEGDGSFLLYYPAYPWQLTEDERLMTEDTFVVKAITDILMSVYKGDVNRAGIEQEIGNVFSCSIG